MYAEKFRLTFMYVNVCVGYIQDDSRSNGFYQCDDPWTLELIDST